MKLSIERRNYSRNPWRMVTDTGREVTRYKSFEHPHMGYITVSASVSGATKAACMAEALEMLADLWESTARIAQPCPNCKATMMTCDRVPAMPTLDPPGYAARVAQLESEGMTTSDAQSVADAEFMQAKP